MIIADDEEYARARLRSGLEAIGVRPEVVAECSDGTEAIVAILTSPADVAFLDMQMPGLTGLDVVRAVGADHMPPVVFVTAFQQYAVDAFQVDAVDYLLKPYTDERLREATDRVTRTATARTRQPLGALIAAREPTYRRHIPAGKDAVHHLVRTEDVEWIEAEGNYARLHLRHGLRLPFTPLIRETMRELEASLDPASFLRVDRSAIVNREYVRTVTYLGRGHHELGLVSGARVQTTQNFAAAVRTLLDGRLLSSNVPPDDRI